MEEILIYSHKTTARLKFVMKLVFRELILVEPIITNDKEEFLSSDLPKLNYGDEQFNDELFVKSSGLLFERGIRSLDFDVFDFEGMKTIFPTYKKSSVLPFDVFSAIFFFVSRYEEYLPYKADLHGRFTAHHSLLSKLGLLEKPIVNIWAIRVKKIIQEKHPDLILASKSYRFTPTYDIDSAYAYTQKGLVRSIGGYFLAIKNFDWEDLIDRTKVLFSRTKDPFDTFDLQIEYQKKYKLRPIYFILFGRYGQFNKNINTRNKNFRFLIKLIGDYARIGIHPSYNMVSDEGLVGNEIKNLEEAINKNISRSRQHFLRLNLPSTYRQLINNNITDDYTMGFAALPGFRAGICSPFNFYDLDFEAETNFKVHPFAVMDGTLKDYMELTPADAILKIKQLITEVKNVNGTFISLWHNESLSDKKRWEGWRRVYEEMLEFATE